MSRPDRGSGWFLVGILGCIAAFIFAVIWMSVRH